MDNESSWEFPNLEHLQAKSMRSISSSSWCRHFGPHAWQRFVKVQLGECLVDVDLVMCLLPPQTDLLYCTKHEASVQCDTCRLQDLDLSWCEMPGCLAVALACASGSSLRSLSLRCVGLDNVDAHIELTDSTSDSQTISVHLAELSEPLEEPMVLSVLARCCPNLTELNLSRSGENICGVRALGDLALSLGHQLFYLDLNWTNIGDAGLLHLVSACPGLRLLGLQGCKALTTDAGTAVVFILKFCRCILFAFFVFLFIYSVLFVLQLTSYLPPPRCSGLTYRG